MEPYHVLPLSVSGPGSNGNKGVLHILQNSKTTPSPSVSLSVLSKTLIKRWGITHLQWCCQSGNKGVLHTLMRSRTGFITGWSSVSYPEHFDIVQTILILLGYIKQTTVVLPAKPSSDESWVGHGFGVKVSLPIALTVLPDIDNFLPHCENVWSKNSLFIIAFFSIHSFLAMK